MKSKLILLLLLASSCTLVYETDHKYLPDTSRDAAITLQTRLISSDATTAIIEGDIALVDNYDSRSLTFYLKSEFVLQPAEGATLTLQNLDVKQFSLPSRKLSAVLFNQATNYSAYDPMNNRSKAFNKLLEDVDGTPVIIGGFAKSGLVSEPGEFFSFDANTYGQQLPVLFGMTKKTGGTNNLFDGVSAAIDKIKPNKIGGDIVVLTDGVDQGSTSTMSQVISNATTSNVRLHIVYMGSQSPTTHAVLAASTNGSFAICPDEKTMITSVASMDRISHQTVTGYRLRIMYKKNVGTFSAGEQISAVVKVIDAYNSYEFNPFVISIKLP